MQMLLVSGSRTCGKGFLRASNTRECHKQPRTGPIDNAHFTPELAFLIAAFDITRALSTWSLLSARLERALARLRGEVKHSITEPEQCRFEWGDFSFGKARKSAHLNLVMVFPPSTTTE